MKFVVQTLLILTDINTYNFLSILQSAYIWVILSNTFLIAPPSSLQIWLKISLIDDYISHILKNVTLTTILVYREFIFAHVVIIIQCLVADLVPHPRKSACMDRKGLSSVNCHSCASYISLIDPLYDNDLDCGGNT